MRRFPLNRCRHWLVVAPLAALAMLFPQISSADEAPAAKSKDEGFTPLLAEDSRSLWTGYEQDSWPKGWELQDGVLHRTSSGGDLMTRQQYGDFDLKFAWKISESGNSGVMYRVSREKGPAYHTGPEYQILDNSRHVDGKNPLTSTGALYGLYAPSRDAAKEPGKWNKARILVRGNRVRHFLNGEKVAEAELGGDDWNKLVAASKFAAWPKFGKNQRGHIVLQDHGDEVWYRNMRIKTLGEAE